MAKAFKKAALSWELYISKDFSHQVATYFLLIWDELEIWLKVKLQNVKKPKLEKRTLFFRFDQY